MIGKIFILAMLLFCIFKVFSIQENCSSNFQQPNNVIQADLVGSLILEIKEIVTNKINDEENYIPRFKNKLDELIEVLQGKSYSTDSNSQMISNILKQLNNMELHNDELEMYLYQKILGVTQNVGDFFTYFNLLKSFMDRHNGYSPEAKKSSGYYDRYADHFLALNPSLQELKIFLGLTFTVTKDRSLTPVRWSAVSLEMGQYVVSKSILRAKTPDVFLGHIALYQDVSFHSKDINHLIAENIDMFLAMDPDPFQVNYLLIFVESESLKKIIRGKYKEKTSPSFRFRRRIGAMIRAVEGAVISEFEEIIERKLQDAESKEEQKDFLSKSSSN
ncbi:MAG: hypothetical protein OXK80_00315 [Bdellovibrionales bacterium]|nr:hypothetical protein [Bdellovibrionales bacterium]